MAAHGHLKGGDSPPLLCSGGTPPVELPPALGPPGHEENGADRASGKEATEMLQGLQPLCYGHRLGQLGVFCLEKKRLQGDIIMAFQYLK